MGTPNHINGRIDLERFKSGLELLRQAHIYHSDTGRSVWEFAVEMRLLKERGLSRNDLRWLVCKGLIEHQREITPRGDDARMFRTTGALTFARRSCFILSRTGVEFTEKLFNGGSAGIQLPANVLPNVLPNKSSKNCPEWDRHRHELRVGDRVVKRFRRPAVNQETILATFEEDGWPARIDDPLPNQGEQDPKQRLHDTIKCLNRSQKRQLIHFQGDGTGEGVLWEFTEEVHSGTS